ncbi:hypothetical protein DFH11DRAFT_1744852 [Phellopilus nigrolimitatus]|nr:hypothetical protein DFH11DRAFT_1744852 [Phellopilus nigrolimitatus]
MGGTLYEEVTSGIFEDVPMLVEDKLSDRVISLGMGHAICPNDPVAAAKFKFKASDILGKLKSATGEGTYWWQQKQWVDWKRDKNHHEQNVTDYLNKIAENIRKEYELPSNDTSREFSCMFKDKAPAEAAVNCKRKPDGVVLDHSKVGTDATWADIHAVMELKSSSHPRAYKAAYLQLLQYARMVFAAQQNRRFVLGVILTGDDRMTFFVFDRAGVLSSERFNIMDEPEKLIRVVAGFLFAENIDLGYDPTIYHRDGERFILFKQVEYKIKEIIYAESSVRGRGTNCFLVEHEGEDAVIKDSWVDNSRNTFEHIIMEKITGVGGVAKIVGHEKVKVRGVNDTTATDRRALRRKNLWKTQRRWQLFGKLETREHRRIMMKPYGKPLEDFQTLAELLTSIKDIIQTIEDLINKKVLHRDVSLRNLVLARENPKDLNSRRRGYIIDFDFAIETDDKEDKCAKGRRTGTLPFMALEMMIDQEKNKIRHAYYHDLESIFYVLCWICTAQEGPSNLRRSLDFDFNSSAVAEWAGYGKDEPTVEDVRKAKQAVVAKADDFNEYVLGQFAPYFEPLRDCVRDMRTLLISTGSSDPKILKTKLEFLEMCRETGLPIPLDILVTIPIADRNEKDVFNSLHKIIDETLATLEEPVPPSNTGSAPSEDQNIDELTPDQIGRTNMRVFEEENILKREAKEIEAEKAEEAEREKNRLEEIAETIEEASEELEDKTQIASGPAQDAYEKDQSKVQAVEPAPNFPPFRRTHNLPSFPSNSRLSGAHSSATLIAPESPTPTSRKRLSRDGPLKDEPEELSSRESKRVKST